MRHVIYFFLVILTVTAAHYRALIQYGLRQAHGQLRIIWEAEPIEEFLQKEDVPDSVKQKLYLVAEVKQFAVKYLGLNASENYQQIYDQGGRPLLWAVTGCKPYKLEPKEWKFPVLGSVPYKGFFNEELAVDEMQRIQAEGYEAGVRTVGGWSTLGWFKDPILSEMLNRSEGDLANLIIHELVHSTIFVKDSVEFNENLASFIADKGAVEFMKTKYGADSQRLTAYRNELHDEQRYIQHMLIGVDSLTVLFDAMEEYQLKDEIRKKKKEQLIRKIMVSTDTLSLKDKRYLSFLKGKMPNNTYFMSFSRYQSKQSQLDTLFVKRFNQKIKPFVRYMKEKHPYL